MRVITLQWFWCFIRLYWCDWTWLVKLCWPETDIKFFVFSWSDHYCSASGKSSSFLPPPHPDESPRYMHFIKLFSECSMFIIRTMYLIEALIRLGLRINCLQWICKAHFNISSEAITDVKVSKLVSCTCVTSLASRLSDSIEFVPVKLCSDFKWFGHRVIMIFWKLIFFEFLFCWKWVSACNYTISLSNV